MSDWICSGVRPLSWTYTSGLIPRRSSERTSAFQSSTARRLDETRGDVEVGGGDERVERRRPELGFELLFELAAEARLDLLPQLGERLELAGRPGELVVHGREHLLVDLLDARGDVRVLAVGKPVGDLLLTTGLLADEALLDLREQSLRPELDDVVALGLAVGRDEVHDHRVAFACGPAVGRREVGDRGAEHLQLGVDQLLGHLWLGRGDLERRPVREPRAVPARRRSP